jgi:hypothetical protein
MQKLDYLQDEELFPLEEEEDDEPPQVNAPLPPQMRRVFGLDQPTRAPGVPFEVQQAADKNKAYADEFGRRPEKPAPKWWQKLGAAGVAFGAGYANAGGRTRPIDARGATEEILAPGYGRKLDEWKGRVQKAGVERDVANANRDAWWKNRKSESDIAQSEAQAEQARQHGKYWENRAEMEQNQWKVNARGQLYNTVTGEIKNPAPTLAERIKEAKDAGLDADEAKVYATGGKLGEPKPSKNPTNPQEVLLNPGQYTPDQVKKAQEIFNAQHREPRDPNAPRPMTPSLKAAIENRKNQALAEAEAKARLRVKGDPAKGTLPEPADEVYAELEGEKQRIQNAYEGEIGAATGDDPGHFSYPAPTPKPAAPKPSTGGRGPRPETAQASPPAAVLDGLTPGEHTFRNGQVWRKNADGSTTRVK